MKSHHQLLDLALALMARGVQDLETVFIHPHPGRYRQVVDFMSVGPLFLTSR
jgi:hypothetical protein